MSYYKAISNGNADTLGIWETWNGAAWVAAGSLPSAADDVYTNNYIVTVTTSQSYLSWNRSSVAAPYSITQGGQFQIDGANAITTQGTVNGANASLGASVGSSCMVRLVTHTNTYSHIGNMVATQQSAGCFWNNSTYSISLLGDQTAGSSSNAFYTTVAITLSVVGNQYGNSYSYGLYFNATVNLTLVGNQYGGSNGGGGIAFVGANNTGTITGNQYAAAGTSRAIASTNSSTLTITGNQYAAGAEAFYNSGSGSILTFIGNSYASSANYAINNTSTSSVIIHTGNNYNYLSVPAIYSPRLFLNVTPTTVWQFSDFGGNTKYLYGAGVNTGHPAPSNVRQGVLYDPNSGTTGTLIVANPATILKGVPTDNTVGTYESTPADFIAALKSDDLGTRLENCATAEIVASLIKNLK